MLRFQARHPNDPKILTILAFFKRLGEYFHTPGIRTRPQIKINFQVAIQRLPYSQIVDWSKHCAHHQIESPSLEQFAEWLSLTAQTFENLKHFYQNKLSQNDSTNPRSNLLQYVNNHSRYDPNNIQGTSKYVSTLDKSSGVRTTSKFNKEQSQHQRQFNSSRNRQQQL